MRFLNTVGGGRVVRIKDNIAYVEDEDGFETPVLTKECVVVGHDGPGPVETPAVGAPAPPAFEKEIRPSAPAPAPADELPVEETPEGENINLVLAYEPKDIKRLSSTTFDAYVVNDSNYYLYFTYSTCAARDSVWTTRYAGIVEPNIQLFINEVAVTDLPGMDRVAFQYVAFKKGKPFNLKAPASIELKLDTTKFAKVHCFRDNLYFDLPVLAFDLVKNDVHYRAKPVDAVSLENAMNSKISIDRKPARRRVVRKQARQDRRGEVIVVDLHISELVDNIRGLSNADILNLQIDEFSRIMDENLKNKGQKIIFIHGKGEGVLRNAIMKELNHRYKGHDVQDASFREYGFGATQVTI